MSRLPWWVDLICTLDSRRPIQLLPCLRYIRRVNVAVISDFVWSLRLLLHLLLLFAFFPHQKLLFLQTLYLGFSVRLFLFLLRFLFVLALLLLNLLLLLSFFSFVRLFLLFSFPLLLRFLYPVSGFFFFPVFFEFCFGFLEPFFDDWIPAVPASTTSVSTCTMSQTLEDQTSVGLREVESNPASETYP